MTQNDKKRNAVTPISRDRPPPTSEEAETAVIGSALLDGGQVVSIAAGKFAITEDSFYFPSFRAIWEAIQVLSKKNRPIDILTVTDELRQQGTLDRVGGSSTLNKIVDATPTSAHAEYYCDIVRKKAALRALITECRAVEREAHETDDADAVVCAAPERFMSIIHTPESEKSNAELMDESRQRWIDASNGKRMAIGLETPWYPLTSLLCGLELGVTIIAGRPSAGKTTLETQMCDHMAGLGHAGYRVTLDSTRAELLERSMCRMAGASLPKLKFGFGHKHHSEIKNARDKLANLPMFIDDKARDINQIRARARAMKAKYGIEYFTVDYIQLIRAADMGRQEWDAVTRVTHVSSMLKDLSFELEIPVVVLCQLSRSVEKEGRDPQLSDLRDSGAIEQDASKVVFLYVDLAKKNAMEKANPGATKHKRPVICNVMKHKNGETGLLPMWLYPPYFRFHPAKYSDDGTLFTDDDLPSSRDHDEKDLKTHPEYMPKPEAVTVHAQQEEFPDADEDTDN
jgi:replicative DNA helicase